MLRVRGVVEDVGSGEGLVGEVLVLGEVLCDLEGINHGKGINGLERG